VDVLTISAFAPSNSAFNFIEHKWSFISKCYTGVVWSAKLEGENKPPREQKQLPEEERQKKEAILFDNILVQAGSYLEGRTIAGSPIHYHPVPCLGEETEFSDYDQWYQLLSSKAKKKTILDPSSQDMLSTFQFLIRHCVRWERVLMFIRCRDDECSHCNSLPAPQETYQWISTYFNGHPPFPIKNPSNPAHYFSLIELINLHADTRSRLLENPPHAELGYCSEQQCQYVFLSKEDRKRHRWLCHSTPNTRSSSLSKRKQTKKRKQLANSNSEAPKQKKQKTEQVSSAEPISPVALVIEDRIEVLLEGDGPCFWLRGTLKRISKSDPAEHCVYFDDGSGKWFTWTGQEIDETPWRRAEIKELHPEPIDFEVI
jgi:hypothetical protein